MELIAPNGKKSNLTAEQYKLVRTKAFKDWFGDWQNDRENSGKVSGITKEPTIWYHSTKSDFLSKKGENIFRKPPFFFALRKDISEDIVRIQHQNFKGRITTKGFFVRYKNPFDITKFNILSDKKLTKIIKENTIYSSEKEIRTFQILLGLPNSLKNTWALTESKSVQEWIKSKGYDSFFVFEDGAKNLAVFKSEQIKLADGSNKTFDGSNPDIRFDKGGQVNSNSFMKWFIDWYKGVSDKMNIAFSLPNAIQPFKEKNAVILDVFEKKNQTINAEPYLKKILEKANEYDVVIYLEPKDEIQQYQKFGFQLTPNKQFMKRLPHFADGGSVKRYNNEIMKKVKKGGITYGKSHAEGGIPVKNASTGDMLEVEGGEGIVNKRSMASDKKVKLNGKEMSLCEAVSQLNQMEGGVQFNCDDVSHRQFLEEMALGGELERGTRTEKEHIQVLKDLYAKRITPKEATRRIAKDHIKEDSRYYSKLAKMEKKMAKGGMTYREYADSQFDENEDRYLPSGYLSEFEIKQADRIKYPILFIEKNGLEYRIKNNDDSVVVVFDNDKQVAYADNKAIMVAPTYQKRGIGLELVRILKERNPNHRFGSMTPEGFNLMGKYYDTYIANNPNIRYADGGYAEATKRWNKKSGLPEDGYRGKAKQFVKDNPEVLMLLKNGGKTEDCGCGLTYGNGGLFNSVFDERIVAEDIEDNPFHKFGIKVDFNEEPTEVLNEIEEISNNFCDVYPEVCSNNLGIKREDMPQIYEEYIPEYLEFLHEMGIDGKIEYDVRVGDLTATQSEISIPRMAKMIKRFENGYYIDEFGNKINPFKKKLIVTKDNFILDGHHRWATMYFLSPDNEVDVLRVNADIKDIVPISKNFGMVQFQKFMLGGRLGLKGIDNYNGQELNSALEKTLLINRQSYPKKGIVVSPLFACEKYGTTPITYSKFGFSINDVGKRNLEYNSLTYNLDGFRSKLRSIIAEKQLDLNFKATKTYQYGVYLEEVYRYSFTDSSFISNQEPMISLIGNEDSSSTKALSFSIVYNQKAFELYENDMDFFESVMEAFSYMFKGYDSNKPLEITQVGERKKRTAKTQTSTSAQSTTQAQTPQAGYWRFKTEQELIDELGSNWESKIQYGWNPRLNYLLGQKIDNDKLVNGKPISGYEIDTFKAYGITSGEKDTGWAIFKDLFKFVPETTQQAPIQSPQVSNLNMDELDTKIKNIQELIQDTFQPDEVVVQQVLLDELEKLNIQKQKVFMSDYYSDNLSKLFNLYSENISNGQRTDMLPACGYTETPSGQPSELDRVQYDLVRKPQFKAWFGDWEEAYRTKNYNGVSKAINPRTGEPLVVYHGKGNMKVEATYFQLAGFPIKYFAENKSYSEWFKNNYNPINILYEFFISVKNPIDLSMIELDELTPNDFVNLVDALYDYKIQTQLIMPDRKVKMWQILRSNPKMLKEIKEKTNYDGFVIYENNPSDVVGGQENTTKDFIAYENNQFKRADGSNHTFFKEVEDFRFAEGGVLKNEL